MIHHIIHYTFFFRRFVIYFFFDGEAHHPFPTVYHVCSQIERFALAKFDRVYLDNISSCKESGRSFVVRQGGGSEASQECGRTLGLAAPPPRALRATAPPRRRPANRIHARNII